MFWVSYRSAWTVGGTFIVRARPFKISKGYGIFTYMNGWFLWVSCRWIYQSHGSLGHNTHCFNGGWNPRGHTLDQQNFHLVNLRIDERRQIVCWKMSDLDRQRWVNKVGPRKTSYKWGYTPVIKHSNGKSTIWRCISYSRRGFSIAMFVYRRV